MIRVYHGTEMQPSDSMVNAIREAWDRHFAMKVDSEEEEIVLINYSRDKHSLRRRIQEYVSIFGSSRVKVIGYQVDESTGVLSVADTYEDLLTSLEMADRISK